MSDLEPLFVCKACRRRARISGRTGIGNYRNGALVADRGWKRRFEEPIALPRGRRLVTLADAGKYITKLPKAEHEAAEWQAAMEALILVATSGGSTMFARIGVMRALNRNVERVFNPDRKESVPAPMAARERRAYDVMRATMNPGRRRALKPNSITNSIRRAGASNSRGWKRKAL